MKRTFAEIGIPFPLYEAPVTPKNDSDYAGFGTCSICGHFNIPCFHIGIGAALMIPCPSCGAMNGLDTYDKKDTPCRQCRAVVDFPAGIASEQNPHVCYTCLREGKAALAKDTEFGMIAWEQVLTGVTHGSIGLQQDQFESVVIDADDDWIGVRLPEEMMLELLRTPGYGTWQGECWLFCCSYPMTFVGEWHQEAFNRRAPDGNGEQLYYAIAADVPPGTWESLGGSLAVYVFECKKCGKLRAHWDMD